METLYGEDISINGLPEFWSSEGWSPMYFKQKDTVNERFRGGYAYAEVMGPFGMLRINQIDGQTVGSEIGMEVQLGHTFYPFHYHNSPEIYISITPEKQGKENLTLIPDSDSPLFTFDSKSNSKKLKLPEGLAAQTEDAQLAAKFKPLAEALICKETEILAEIDATQGKPADIDGYYMPDDDKAYAAMCPSVISNEALASLN